MWVDATVNVIRVFAIFCDVITFPVYLVLQQPWKRRKLSNRIKVSFLELFIATHLVMDSARTMWPKNKIIIQKCYDHSKDDQSSEPYLHLS